MRVPTLNKQNKKLLSFLAIVGVIVLVVSYSSSLSAYTNSIVNPGWEIYNQITAMQTDAGVKTGPNEFQQPHDISGPYWKVDEDASNYGFPTIMVQTSDLDHVDFSGQEIPDTETAKVTKTVVRNNHTYLLDYHIYMFDMTIRTIADRIQVQGGSFLTTPVWEHETSWGVQSEGTLGTTWTEGKVGKQFVGGIYVKFVISPWRGGTLVSTPENYTINGAWAGVMNSYVFQKDGGQVANQWGESPTPSLEAPMFQRGGLDNGAQVPMFADDGQYGTPTPKADWDLSATPDTRIASNVVLYLPTQLQAGAYLTRDWAGAVNGLTPIDVFIKYTVRVDVLTTHDFILQTAVNPPELETPTDFFSWVLGFWDSPATQATIWIFVAAIIGLAFFYVYLKNRGRGGDRQ